MHALIARGTGTGWISGPRNEDFTIDVEAAKKAIAEHRPEVVFITSPNNPTGTAVDADTVVALYDAAQAARPSMVVVDEAYGEFSHHPSLLPLIEGRPHLVLSRTMSKAFGAAGLRLGYLAAAPAVVDAVQLVRLPVPPVVRHPGHRARRPGAHRYAARVRRAAQERARPAGRRACGSSASPSPTRTPTSSSSAASPTATPPGRRSSTGASWSGTTAYRGGCGSPRAPRQRTTRSSMRCAN